MTDPQWAAADHYFEDLLIPKADSLEWLLENNANAGLPQIDVSPLQGRQLELLVRIANAKRILEIGTLGGYSTVCMARALRPGGVIVSLELEQSHAEVAASNFQQAGVDQFVEVMVGPAVESLRTLVDRKAVPFDFVFIDADKENNPSYLEWTLKLTRQGSVILFDNVVRDGQVLNAETDDPSVIGIRKVHEMIAATSDLVATAIQTVGGKGYDGFTIAVRQ